MKAPSNLLTGALIVVLAFAAYSEGKDAATAREQSRARDSVATIVLNGHANALRVLRARTDSVERENAQLTKASIILAHRAHTLRVTADSATHDLDSVVAVACPDVRPLVEKALQAEYAVEANLTAQLANKTQAFSNDSTLLITANKQITQDSLDLARVEGLREEAEKQAKPNLFRRVRDALPVAAAIVLLTKIL